MSRKSNFRLYRVWDGIIQRCCNPMITFLGETLCTADWCERFGRSGSTLWRRLKSGWSIEDALTKPKQKRTKKMDGGDDNETDWRR